MIKIGDPFYRKHTKYYDGWEYFKVDKIEIKSLEKPNEVVLCIIPITEEEYRNLLNNLIVDNSD